MPTINIIDEAHVSRNMCVCAYVYADVRTVHKGIE
jgi:hypothetical protein